MEGGIRDDVSLDYVAFKIFTTQNRYEAFVCYNGKTDEIGSGLIEQLASFLPEVKNLLTSNNDEILKLQLPENLKGSAWFTKSSFTRFLHIAGVPEFLRTCNAIRDEMSQLEEARKFHLSLYVKGNQEHPGPGRLEEAGYSNSNAIGMADKPELQSTLLDPTKNELLRAMDLRIMALREELVSAFNVAASSTCSSEQIAEMVSFLRYFRAMDLRNCLVKNLAVGLKNQAADAQEVSLIISCDLRNDSEKMVDGLVPEASSANAAKHVMYRASPAKAAQVERQSLSGSDESSSCTDEDRPNTERSRSLVRSASPRRSASPMRRVQIGRSGSRRPTALAIKSLGYIPGRERISSSRDATGNSSDEDLRDPPKKTEYNATRISVQDAISLFERKQRDQNPELQKMRSSVDTSVSVNKSVLRRWSAGMGDSSTQCQPESGFEGSNEKTENSLADGESKINAEEVKHESDFNDEIVKPNETANTEAPSATGESRLSYSADNMEDVVVAQTEEIHDKVKPSDEWSRQKEAELNQMLLRYQSMVMSNSKSQEFPSEQRGSYYDHYKQKRDEKLRGNTSGKQPGKEGKALQENLNKKKAGLPTKNVAVASKQESFVRPRKSQKALSPSIQPKKDVSRPALKKTSPKAPLPAARKSWPSAPSSKTAIPTPPKTPNSISSVGSAPVRRKSLPISSPSKPSLKTERPEQLKPIKKTPDEKKNDLKGQEGKKPVVKKSSNVAKTKPQTMTEDGSSNASAKQSFYSKVTKKGSVVPLESKDSKPFLRKGSRIGPGVGPVAKKKAPQLDETLQNNGSLIPVHDEVVAEIPNLVTQQEEGDLDLPVSDNVTLESEVSVNSQEKCENMENHSQFVSETEANFANTAESPVDIQSDEVMTISPVAWVEIEEHPEPPILCDSIEPQIPMPNNIAPSASSPRVRHSLSQMLQEDNGEPEIAEWGKAENPPAVVYQKDVPKGLKRLLKFARKSKGDANITGWSSPSVFSEGEEDSEEPKAASKRHAEVLMRKSAQANGFGHQKSLLVSSYDGGYSSMRSMDSVQPHDLPSAGMSTTRKYSAQGSHKLQEGRDMSAGATSMKASRSFFSLSTFRSSKSNEGKLR
ncbi:hypothetical protein Sjap_000893 [Stephania japonica]|uniref:COP1-interacting protein 7 n=1 Tax=Stephania japonica TaxID=461633 RepID=A0AAP0PQY6_9MAGN